MDMERFIARWRGGEGGQERANSVMFLLELCDALGVERPAAAGTTQARNDYVFERAVRFGGAEGAVGHIDLYKRGHFLLEAKQSRRAGDPGASPRSADLLMRRARRQAIRYARALPADHGRPPFLILCDVGRALELLADFRGGCSYDFYPDRERARILLEDLTRPATCELLRAVWTAPYSLDPARSSGIPTAPRRSHRHPHRAALTAVMVSGRGPAFPPGRRYEATPQTA